MDFWRRQSWKIASMWPIWFAISAVLLAAAVGAWAVRGLNYGIDFTGGSLHKYSLERPLASGEEIRFIAAARAAVEDLGITHSQIQVAGGNLLLIRTATKEQGPAAQESERIRAALSEKLGQQVGETRLVASDLVGPVVGEQLRNSALLALILGNLLILIYLTVRYEFRIAVACVVALIHDVVVMVGAMALFGVELNSEFIAAILTVVGFSADDSVVIFDRIRENRRLHRGADLESVANASLLQTMARSINTVLVVLFTLLALFFLGGSTIRPFILAMLVGMTMGMYSSIFVAAPLVVVWDRWSQRRRGRVVAPARQRVAVAGSGAVREPLLAAPEEQPVVEHVTAEQALRRVQSTAQEEKRAARRERRKAKAGTKGKRRH